jgi:hypothetical protein
MRIHRNAAVLAAVLLAAACARALPPPGGVRDTQPPRLIETAPGPLAVVPGFTGPAVFRFDERLSERNFSESLVIVSPLDGALRIERKGSEVRVRIDGGWRPDRIYRVVLLPGLRDLFGNARTEAAEIVFSTGPPVPETAIAGLILERLTGRPPQTALVTAVRRGDSVAYMAVGDTAGFFSLRHLPLGVYELFAFADQNRNRRRDAMEPVDNATLSLGSPSDTLMQVFRVLAPDTTPPRVTRAEYVDSLHVRITLDDHVDVEAQLTGAGAEIHVLPDSALYGAATRLVQAPLFERERREAAAAGADTAAAAPQEPVRPPTGRAALAVTQEPLPTREIMVVLSRPLERGLDYTITVGGIMNLHGLSGGGVARFSTPRPAPAAPAQPPPDTTRSR